VKVSFLTLRRAPTTSSRVETTKPSLRRAPSNLPALGARAWGVGHRHVADADGLREEAVAGARGKGGLVGRAKPMNGTDAGPTAPKCDARRQMPSASALRALEFFKHASRHPASCRVCVPLADPWRFPCDFPTICACCEDIVAIRYMIDTCE
jgi:hypothetical protein